jgi:predicted RNA-binding Zn ribbon-like protein
VSTPHRAEFLFLAGHPCLDFLNTRPLTKGRATELLGTVEDLVRWLTRAGRLDSRAAADALKRWGDSAEGTRIAERARAFRETLRHMADGIVRERGIAAEGPAAINFILAENDGTLRLERHAGAFRTRFAARPTQAISLLGNVAEAAAELLSVRDQELIRRCANPDCGLFFYDATRNHRRQWCAMATCGNLMKVRAFRKRARRRAV